MGISVPKKTKDMLLCSVCNLNELEFFFFFFISFFYLPYIQYFTVILCDELRMNYALMMMTDPSSLTGTKNSGLLKGAHNFQYFNYFECVQNYH